MSIFTGLDEKRAQLSTGCAWLVRHPKDPSGKFSIIGLTKSVPVPSGEEETIDIEVLQSSTTGKVGTGKVTLEETDVSVYDHRDNKYRFEMLQGQTLDFLTVYPDMAGYRFTGTIKYIPQPPENGDSPMANVHVIPVSANTKSVKNTRGLVIENLYWANAIPETAEVGQAVDFAVRQEATPQFAVNKILTDEDGDETEEVAQTADFTLDGSKITFNVEGLYVITASAAGYSPWFTTVYVEPKKISY